MNWHKKGLQSLVLSIHYNIFSSLVLGSIAKWLLWSVRSKDGYLRLRLLVDSWATRSEATVRAIVTRMARRLARAFRASRRRRCEAASRWEERRLAWIYSHHEREVTHTLTPHWYHVHTCLLAIFNSTVELFRQHQALIFWRSLTLLKIRFAAKLKILSLIYYLEFDSRA